MLLMKGWQETRWRLTAGFVYVLSVIAMNYPARHQPPGPKIPGVLFALFGLLSTIVLTLAGSGVKTQSPCGFPEGLAESTQFTMSLPVSRLRLFMVRASVGWLEALAAVLISACLAWSLFPSVRANMTPADFGRLILATLLWLTLPYWSALFFESFLAEPLSFIPAGWTVALFVWILHHIRTGSGSNECLRPELSVDHA